MITITLPRATVEQALEALRHVVRQAQENLVPTIHYGPVNDVMNRLEAALAEPVQEPVAHRVVAGALFDFMGWLTSRRERLVLSSTDDAAPAADAIKDFAEMRGLSLDDAKVQDWNTAPPQRKPLTEEEVFRIAREAGLGWDEKYHWYVGSESLARFAHLIHTRGQA